MTSPPITSSIVLEPVEVIARGLLSFLQEALPGTPVRLLEDPATLRCGPSDLVLAGPSCVAAYLDRRVAATGPPGTTAAERAMVAVQDPDAVDFAAMLLAGVEVAWDLRGPFPTFAAAASAAARGDSWVSESLTSAMATDIGLRLRRGQEAANYGLTVREAEVLRLMATGLGNRDIADRLFISVNTVKNHVRAVLDKLHAASRTEAVMVGARVGLVDLDRIKAL